MNSTKFQPRRSLCPAKCLLFATSILLLRAYADDPEWWTLQNPPVIDGMSSELANNGTANVGQGKWIAKCALQALESQLGADSPVVTSIKADLYKTGEGSASGVFFPGRPAIPDPEWLEAQKAPLRIGELKALAAPFYRHLSNLDASWVANQLQSNGFIFQGASGYFRDPDGTYFPWNPADNTNSSANHSVVNIGQMKAVFALHIETLGASSDWDVDGDGLSKSQEIAAGTNPLKADTDGDGINDGQEVAWDLSPLDPSDAALDFDNDGVSNLKEILLGRPPTGLFHMEIIALNSGAGESYSATGPSGELLLKRNGQVVSTTNSQLGQGQILDWLGSPTTQVARTRTQLPLGNWEIAGLSPKTGVTEVFPAADGKVRMQHWLREFDPGNGLEIAGDFLLLERDVLGGTGTAIDWEAISQQLFVDGFTPNVVGDLPPVVLTSGQGTQVVIETAGRYLMLRGDDGQCWAELPKSDLPVSSSISWLLLSEEGLAVGRTVPDNRMIVWGGGPIGVGNLVALDFPTGWGSDGWEILSSISNKGGSRFLVKRLPSAPATSPTYYQVNALGGTWTFVPIPDWFGQPGDSIEQIGEQGRIIGTGATPWMDVSGARVRFSKLKIMDSAIHSLADMGLQGFEPVNITVDGVITARAVSASSTPVVVQLIPLLDEDGDGVPDDRELAYGDWLRDTYGIAAPTQASQFNVNEDYASTGETAATISGVPAALSPVRGGIRQTCITTSAVHKGLWEPAEGLYPEYYFKKNEYYVHWQKNETNVSETIAWDNVSTVLKVCPDQPISENWDSPRVELLWEPTSFETVSMSLHNTFTYSTVTNEEVWSYSGTPSDPPWVTAVMAIKSTPTGQPPANSSLPHTERIPTVPQPHQIWTPPSGPYQNPYISESSASYENTYEDDWGSPDGSTTTEKIKLSDKVHWRKLAEDAFDAARGNLAYGAWSSVVEGGYGDGSEYTVMKGVPEGRYSEGTWAVKAGSAPMTVMIEKREILKLAGGVTMYISPPTRVTREFLTLQPGQRQTIRKNTVPEDDADWVSWEVSEVEGAIYTDYNGDGSLDARDRTSSATPFRFWLNNDQDDREQDEIAVPQKSDALDLIIPTARDLEDFCRIVLQTGSLQDELRNNQIQAKLKWSPAPGGAPAIRLWKTWDQNDYLSNPSTQSSIVNMVGLVGASGSLALPPDIWTTNPNQMLLFEGVASGAGRLGLFVTSPGSSEEYEIGSVYISIQDVRTLYRRARITLEPEQIPHPWDNPSPAPMKWVWDDHGNPADFTPLQDKTCVYVHGWRMPYNLTQNWASTGFKRLWHQGYRGRFYSFRWPTFSQDNNGVPDNIDDWTEKPNPPPDIPPPGVTTYNQSEYRAWLSGPVLADFVNHLPNPGERRLFAHSMGNVVSGAAFRSGMDVAYYAMCNPAMSAMAYDPAIDGNPFVTADVDPDPAFRAAYGIRNKFSVIGPATEVHNFVLPQDQAMPSWWDNNVFFKPHPLVNAELFGYNYNPTAVWAEKMTLKHGIATVRSVQSLSEAMGYVVRSRTEAAGANLRTAGVIDCTIDMSTYGWDDMHSAQWRKSIQKTWEFWRKLDEALKLSQ